MVKEKELDNPHDKGYKFLLSSEKIFLELIESFVDKGWIEKIDPKEMTRIDKSYILQDFDEKEADLVYRLKIKGQDVIFYILMELQSTVDFQMPYRLLLYMVEIWRDTLKNISKDEASRKDFRLPAIVPMVLYNGENNWTANTSFKEGLSEHEMFSEYVLNFKYILLDINRYKKDKLLEMSNLISTVFLLDQNMSGEEFYRRLTDSIAVLKKFTQEEFQMFKVWFNNIASRGLPQDVKEEVKGIIDSSRLEEVDTMVTNIEKLFGKVRTDGVEEGIEKGIEKGKEEVVRNMLQKNIPENVIAEFTGLLVENIEKIKREIGLSTK